MDTSSAEQSKG